MLMNLEVKDDNPASNRGRCPHLDWTKGPNLQQGNTLLNIMFNVFRDSHNNYPLCRRQTS